MLKEAISAIVLIFRSVKTKITEKRKTRNAGTIGVFFLTFKKNGGKKPSFANPHINLGETVERIKTVLAVEKRAQKFTNQKPILPRELEAAKAKGAVLSLKLFQPTKETEEKATKV